MTAEGSCLRLPGTTQDRHAVADTWLDSSMRASLFPGVASNAPPPGEQSYILNVQEARRTADLKMPNRGPNMRTALWVPEPKGTGYSLFPLDRRATLPHVPRSFSRGNLCQEFAASPEPNRPKATPFTGVAWLRKKAGSANTLRQIRLGFSCQI